MWILGGFLALGAVLDSVANAISLLTPLVASIGTACIVLVWVLAHIILPSHPLSWVVGTQRVRVTKLGVQPTAFAVGMILLLWMPSVIAQWQPLPGPGDTAEDKSVQLGDVTLVVGRVEAPVFWLFNAGRARADRPKYQFLLYNLNQDDTNQPRRILHIPVKLIEDYILSQRALGPWRILDLSQRAKEVELGHTVFGYVMVQCANCGTVRYYWIFLKVGWAGWTLDVPESESYMLNRMLAKIIYTGEQATSTVDSVIPLKGRKPIE